MADSARDAQSAQVCANCPVPAPYQLQAWEWRSFYVFTITLFIAQVLLLILFGFLWLSHKHLEDKFKQRRPEEERVVRSESEPVGKD